MIKRYALFLLLSLVGGLIAWRGCIYAQETHPTGQFNDYSQEPHLTGQDVVPVFEGWEQNGDGSYEMYFGYMNRNFKENLVVPVGSSNSFEPGQPDRGQPTYFYPRRQMFLFHVRVPKDWGDQDLTWTLTSHGVTEKAHGHLLPVWVIDKRLITANVHGSSQLDVVDRDEPPQVTIAPGSRDITLPNTLSLSVTVTDDGIPKVGEFHHFAGRGRGGSQAPFFNVSLPTQPRWPEGLNVLWTEYRGPGPVTFAPDGYERVTDGSENKATVSFSQAGTYVLQAVASDSALETRQNVTVNVHASPSRP